MLSRASRHWVGTARPRSLTPLAPTTQTRWVSRRQPVRGSRDDGRVGPVFEGRLHATNQLAKRLSNQELWTANRGPQKKVDRGDGTYVSVDNKRVNIVGDKMCDDILEYLGPSLERHKGCDLIDLNPGVGVWSLALNKALQPRTHVLLEPDKDFYYQYHKEELLKRPGVQVLGDSGVEWEALERILPLLERHRARERREPQERNDMLLMTANITWWPNRPWTGFANVGDLIMFQLLKAIRLQTLFQRYGMVRMLVWMRDDQQASILPRSIKYRGQPALEGEFSCEWIRSVAEPDHEANGDTTAQLRHKREVELDQTSSLKTIRRMREAGIVMPEDRKSMWVKQMEVLEGELLKQAEATGEGVGENGDLVVTKVKVQAPPKKARGRRTKKELEEDQKREAAIAAAAAAASSPLCPNVPATIINATVEQRELEKIEERGELTEEQAVRLKYLRKHARRRTRETAVFDDLLEEWQQIPRRAHEQSDVPSQKRDEAWNDKIRLLHSRQPIDFRNILANHHLLNQDPPVLHWDRRQFEPLVVKLTEFFPNVACSLLDIQPKAMHPLLRETGEGTSRAGDMLGFMMQTVGRAATDPVSKSFNAIYPGAGRLALRCPSFTDIKQGGMCGTGQNEMFARIMNERQWIEFLEAYMRWPFRMDYYDLVSRLSDTIDSEHNIDNAMGKSV